MQTTGRSVSVGDARYDWMVLADNWITSGSAFGAIASNADEVYEESGDQVLQETGQRRYIDPQHGSTLLLLPVGVGTANQIGDIRVWGYSAIRTRAADMGGISGQRVRRRQWHGTLLCQARFTLGTKAGVAGGVLGSTVLYADTLADTGAGKRISDLVKFYQPSAADEGSVILAIDCLGFEKIGIDLRREDISTSVNCLHRWIGGC